MLPLLDDLGPILFDTGQVLGDLTVRFADLVSSPAFRADLVTFGRGNIDIIERLGDAGLSLTGGLKDISVAAQPLATRLSDITANLADLLEKAIAVAREDGRLGAFFDRVGDRIETVISSVGLLGSGLFKVFSEAAPQGDIYLSKIERLAAKFDLLVERARDSGALARFFLESQPAVEELGRLLGAVVETVFRIGQANFGNFIQLSQAVRENLLPAIEDAAEAMSGDFLVSLVDVTARLTEFYAVFIAGNPTVLLLVDTVSGFLGLVNDLATDVPILGDVFVGLVGALVAVRVAVSLVKLAEFITGLGALKTVIADSTLISSTGRLAGAVGVLGKAFTIGAVVLGVKAAIDALAPSVDDARRSVEKSSDVVAEFDRQLQKLNDPGRLDRLLSAVKDVTSNPLGTFFETLTFGLYDARVESDKLAISAEKFASTLNVSSQQKYIDGLKKQGKETGKYQDILTKTIDELAKEGIAQEEVTKRVKEVEDTLKGVNVELQRHTDKLREATTQALALSGASIGTEAAVDDLATAVSESSGNFDINTEAGRRTMTALDNLVGSIQREIEELTKAAAAGSIDNDRKAELLAHLDELARSGYPGATDQANRLRAELEAISPIYSARVALDINDALDRINELANAVGRAVAGAAVRVAGAALEGRAEGGRVLARKIYLVGEKGPELFVPDGNGEILPKIPRPQDFHSPQLDKLVEAGRPTLTTGLNAPSAHSFAGAPIVSAAYTLTKQVAGLTDVASDMVGRVDDVLSRIEAVRTGSGAASIQTQTVNVNSPLMTIVQTFGPGQGAEDLLAAMEAVAKNEDAKLMAMVMRLFGASPGARGD